MSEKLKWTIYGIIFGLFFPIITAIILITCKGHCPIDIPFIVISTAPIVLGFTGYLIGINREKLIEKIKKENELKYTEKLNRQLDEIFDNLHFGLCVVNKDLIIEPNLYNEVFIEIFGENDYSNKSIFDTIFFGITDNYRKEIIEFFKIVFENTSTSEEMLNDFSPIKKFNYFYRKEEGVIEKHIATKIIRNIDENSKTVRNVIVTFEDVTLMDKIEKEYKEKEELYQKRYTQLVAFLSNDIDIVKSFISDSNLILKVVSEFLRNIKQNEVNKEILSKILGKIHTLKGSAFTLGFVYIADAAKSMEDFIKSILEKPIDLATMLDLIKEFEKIQSERKFLEKTIESLEKIISELPTEAKERRAKAGLSSFEDYLKRIYEKNITPQTEQNYIELLKKELIQISNSASKELNKKVNLVFEHNISKLDENLYRNLKQVFLHLIRNSIDHGIEFPDERIKNGKPEFGNIKINISEYENSYRIIYSDDGIGLDAEKIKAKAIEKNIISIEEANKMKKNEILNLIFKEGFSTKNDQNMIAGTGIGMTEIKNVINKLKGKLKIYNSPKKGLKFEIIIPKI